MPFRVPFPGIHSLARSDSSISTPISTLPMSIAARASSNWQRHKMDNKRQCVRWRSSPGRAGRLANTGTGHTRTGCRTKPHPLPLGAFLLAGTASHPVRARAPPASLTVFLELAFYTSCFRHLTFAAIHFVFFYCQ
jgi:hypothetical protein